MLMLPFSSRYRLSAAASVVLPEPGRPIIKIRCVMQLFNGLCLSLKITVNLVVLLNVVPPLVPWNASII